MKVSQVDEQMNKQRDRWRGTSNDNTTKSHHKVLWMVRAHPLVHGGSSKGWVQAVQMEEQLAVVTGNERTYPAAPAGKGTDLLLSSRHLYFVIFNILSE